jgi:hypothetical protein
MKIGLTQAEVDQYFSGPAFLAWFEFYLNLYFFGEKFCK